MKHCIYELSELLQKQRTVTTKVPQKQINWGTAVQGYYRQMIALRMATEDRYPLQHRFRKNVNRAEDLTRRLIDRLEEEVFNGEYIGEDFYDGHIKEDEWWIPRNNIRSTRYSRLPQMTREERMIVRKHLEQFDDFLGLLRCDLQRTKYTKTLDACERLKILIGGLDGWADDVYWPSRKRK